MLNNRVFTFNIFRTRRIKQIIHARIFHRFSTKESATHAIVAVHNTDINGQIVKCSWGKESGDPNNAPVAGQVIFFRFFYQIRIALPLGILFIVE